jgi:hypothetical protein
MLIGGRCRLPIQRCSKGGIRNKIDCVMLVKRDEEPG